MAVSGFALAAIGAGTLLIWSGIKGKSITQALQAVIQGKPPAAAGPSVSDAGTAGGGGSKTPAGATFNAGQLAALWLTAGGDPAQAANAACHAMQESSGNPKATSSNPDGGTNVGLWQLDTLGKGAGYSVQQLMNPQLNAQLTVLGTSNGTDWSAWATPGC
ncbi:MAG TPA: hypothetical protein VKU39_11240 [Streptosporangiaceae bacterium]|nr:hypothetical protein [Streptosporangiaceae bacterium]